MENNKKAVPGEEAEITNNELARMIKVGFDGVDERFRQADSRLEEMQGDIRLIRSDVEDIKLRLGSKANKMDIDALEERVDVLEGQSPRIAPTMAV